MSTIYDAPVSTESGHGGPGDPLGYGGRPEGPGGGPPRRTGRRLAVALAAFALGAGAVWGAQQAGLTPGSNTVLTTAQIAARTDPGLVDVVTTLGYQHAQAAGTGMVLTSSGEVLTNNHVINGATSISVTDVGNHHTYQAKVVGYDRSHDIAVLQLQGASGLQTVSTGSSSSAAVGQKVVALGNAGGKGGTPSVAVGKITGLNASITASDEGSGTSEQLHGLIHHNAAIQPGDSGGALVDTAGQVIGVNTAASSGFQFQSGQSQTQAFAVPISQALAIADQIEAGKSSATVHIGSTAFLGVGISPASSSQSSGVPAGSGALVAGSVSGSPAGQAGITAGDVIVSVGGQKVTSPEDLQTVMGQHRPGDSVRIGWTDQVGQAHSATVVLANGPAA
ncbi:MAG TPA: trypsin-like peptidase domain-containing protein [Streptosporangiaceae bacterium]|jgi:S1-C subfamily serine protease